MSRSVHKVSTVARIVFPIFNASNALVTGRAASITSNLLKDGAADATVVTIAEDGTSGIYSATFTPASTGHWFLLVRDSTNAPRGYDHEWDVTTYGTLGGQVVDGSGRVDLGLWQGVSPVALNGNAHIYAHAYTVAADAVNAAALAGDAVTEIQAGLATAAALAVTDAVADAILANTDVATSTRAAPADVPSAAANATAVGALTKDGYTLLEHVGIQSAVLAGKASGGPGGTAFRDLADARDAVTTTADEDGDRSAVAIVA